MLGGKGEYGLRVNREIAPRSEQIGGHFETEGDHRGAGKGKPFCGKNIPNDRSEPRACRRKHPQFVHELGKLDAATASPWIACVRRHEIGIVAENFETQSTFKRTKFPQDQQVESTLVQVA